MENLKREKAEEIIERKEMEKSGLSSAGGSDDPVVIQSLEKQISELQRQKSELNSKLATANQTVKSLTSHARKAKVLKAEVIKKEKVRNIYMFYLITQLRLLAILL